MQKIKNGVVGCVLLMFIVGHNAVQGMKRKREIIDSALLQVVEGAYHHDNHVTFVNQMARQHAVRPLVRHDQRSAFQKFTRVNKAMEVEPAIQRKIVTFMEPVVTQTIEIPRIKRVLPSVIELPTIEAPKIELPVIEVLTIEPLIIETPKTEPPMIEALKIETPIMEVPEIELVIIQALNTVKKGSYRCNKCRYTTAHKNWLRAHYRAHTMQKNSAIIVHCCTACDYLTDQKRQFNDHLAKHQDEEKNSYVNIFM